MPYEDLTILAGNEKHGYYFDQKSPQAVVHSTKDVNVASSPSISTPTQAGGVWDMRDTQGSKAITHLDWSQGAGQRNLDGEDAVAQRFLSSHYAEISDPGKMSLAHDVVLEEPAWPVGGPVYSLNGVLWLGVSGGGSSSKCLRYSPDDGVTWSEITCTSTPDINSTVSDICTDGSRVFFCVSSPDAGAKGIYCNTSGSPYTFARFGTTPTTDKAITHIAYQGGFLYAATSAGAGLVDATTGVYTQKTPAFLNITNSTVALESASNSVYWVVSQGGRSYAYELTYDATATTMQTTQFVELQSQFVCTCALGYLSTLYLGGYFQSMYPGVGRGGIYSAETGGGELAPLLELGDYPETTSEPSSIANDNRIYAIGEAGRDLYFLTSNACYRWDIDHSGYSHVFDHSGCGAVQTTNVWSSNSLLSWDGVDTGHPSGWTVTNDTPADWAYINSGGFTSAKYGGTGSVWSVTPPTAGSVDPVMDNAAGTSLRFNVPGDQTGPVDVVLKDGTREARFTIGTTSLQLRQYSEATKVETYIQSFPETQASGNWIPGQYVNYSYHNAYTVQTIVPGYWVTLDNGAEWWVAPYPILEVIPAGWDSYWEEGYWEIVTIPAHTETSTRIVGSGNFYWDNEEVVAGETKTSTVLTAACPVEKTVLITLKGVTASISLDNGVTTLLTTNLTKANTNTNSIAVTWNAGASVESMVVNTSGFSSTQAAAAFRPSIVKHRGVLFAPYSNALTGTTVDGYVYAGAPFASTGYVIQSPTTFHTGSIPKDFQYISISHEKLPGNHVCWVEAEWEIDGVKGRGLGATSGTETRIPIASRGYGIGTTTILRTTDTSLTPIVKGVNVVWDFVKKRQHLYTLNCVEGVNNGHWAEDPTAAIRFLFTQCNKQSVFTDKFSGSYSGVIEEIEFVPANTSLSESPSGMATIMVREV